MSTQRAYMFIGGHPDDADIRFGGTAIRLLENGQKVIFVSVTDGSAGHQTMGRAELAKRRYAETQAVAKFLGVHYIVMDGVDGQLFPDLAMREKLIPLVRQHKPDVIITHRPNDYHPDHRATGQLVQDCSFLLGVPLVCPDAPRLEQSPYIFYCHDNFTQPTFFRPDVITDITAVMNKKMESLAHHESQVFEWLPFINKFPEPAPANKEERIEFCKRNWRNRGGALSFVPLLHDPQAKYAEALECCEYGAKVTPEIAKELFPFSMINFAA